MVFAACSFGMSRSRNDLKVEKSRSALTDCTVCSSGPAETKASEAVPILNLSTEPKAQSDERTDSVLPWPWSTQALVRAIERAVHAPDGEPS